MLKQSWFLRATKSIVGKGLLGQTGAVHKACRKMLAAPFSFGNINRLHPLFKTKAQELCEALGRVTDHASEAGTEAVFDPAEVFMKAFLDIIGVAVLGRELSNLDTVGLEKCDDEDHPFHRAFAEFFAPPNKLKQLLIFASGFMPVRWIPLQANRDFNSAMASIHAVVKSLIEERVIEVKSSLLDKKHDQNSMDDLLTFIIQESLPGGSAEALKHDVLKDHVSLRVYLFFILCKISLAVQIIY